MEESKRVKKLRRDIIAAIPKFPNNRETKTKLEEMPLTTLLIHYLNWMSRYLSVKPRKIVIEPAITSDCRWRNLKLQIESLLEKARKGENLTPHLSTQPHSKGYTPKSSVKRPDVDQWADKDFLLNAMGFHHFHIGTELEPNGYIERTNDVIFAKVSREEFTAIGIFDHSVFESTGEGMSPERKRLWEIFGTHITREVPTGSFVKPSPISTSGHPIHLVSIAQEYSRVIREIDPKLEDRKFVQDLYKGAGCEVPIKSKLEWGLNFSDLGIHEKTLNHFFVLCRGFN